MLLSFSHAVAKSVKPPPGVPHVCYCFTPMRYAWHLRGAYFPKPNGDQPYGVFSGKLFRAPVDAARDAMLDRIRDWDQSTSGRVSHFVAISRTVAQRIRECYGRESRVIYPPVDTRFYRPDDTPREDFYLCVGALVPYKKTELAIEACNRSGRRLVVIGDGPEFKRLERLAGPSVTMLGWQSDEVVRNHLRRCRALLFPGQEDFGIVPVEAQACGTPVIAFGQGGVTETVAPANENHVGGGVFFHEQTASAIEEAIEWLERNPRRLCRRLARNGPNTSTPNAMNANW